MPEAAQICSILCRRVCKREPATSGDVHGTELLFLSIRDLDEEEISKLGIIRGEGKEAEQTQCFKIYQLPPIAPNEVQQNLCLASSEKISESFRLEKTPKITESNH